MGMLYRKLAIYEFGCRNILYLMLTHCLSIAYIRKDYIVETIYYFEIVKPNILLRKLMQRKKKTKRGRNVGETSM